MESKYSRVFTQSEMPVIVEKVKQMLGKCREIFIVFMFIRKKSAKRKSMSKSKSKCFAILCNVKQVCLPWLECIISVNQFELLGLQFGL